MTARVFASLVLPKHHPRRADRIGDDRVEAVERADGSLAFLVADGATGSGEGWRASGILADAFLREGPSLSGAFQWADFLAEADGAVRSELKGWADTTGIALSLEGNEIHGASAGDSMAYLVGDAGWTEITAKQARKPRIGNFADPIPFILEIREARWLVAATDGLWDQALQGDIRGVVEKAEDPGRLVQSLLDHVVEFNDGYLRDDFGVLAVRL